MLNTDVFRMKKNNILLIVVDQVIRDTLACYGGKVCRTPNLDQLATKAVVFSSAYTPVSLCSPARASLFSGMQPHQHGMLFNVTEHMYGRESLSEKTELLGTALSRTEYQCGYAGKWHIDSLGPEKHGFSGTHFAGYGLPGLMPEYDEWLRKNGISGQTSVEILDYHSPAGTIRKTSMPPPYGYDGIIELPPELTPSGFVADKTISLLDAMKDGPFFITSAFWGPHHPALPTRNFLAMYDGVEVEPWDNYSDDLAGKPEIQRRYRDRLNDKLFGDDWGSWEETIRRHFAFMTMIDWQIGRILRHLEELGLDEHTLIIFTSDHGDTLGCHGGQFDKGPYMYEETYKIPLLIRFPKQTQRYDVSSPVMNMDIYATILDCAGVTIPEGRDSVSLMPSVKHPEQKYRDYVVGQFSGFDVRGLYSQRMIICDGWKYVFNPGGTDELYNLSQDPSELHNLFNRKEARDIHHKLMRMLIQDMAKNSDPLVQHARELMGLSTEM